MDNVDAQCSIHQTVHINSESISVTRVDQLLYHETHFGFVTHRVHSESSLCE